MRPRLPRLIDHLARWLFRLALRAFPPADRHLSGASLETAVLDAATAALRTHGWLGLVWTLAAETVDVVWAGLGMRLRAPGLRVGILEGWRGTTGGWLGDVRFALRGLRRNPGFAWAAVTVLALGIGASTAIFSVVDGVLFRPLPYPESDRLVLLWNRVQDDPTRMIPISGPDVAVFRERTRLFDGFAFASRVTDATLTTSGPTHARMAMVTSDFFDLLGARAQLGRTFVPEDAVAPQDGAPSMPPTPLVLSHALWVRTFGQEPNVLGRSVRINGQAAVIVGVMPEDFSVLLPPHAGIPENVDAWSPIRVDLRAFERTDGRTLDQDSDHAGPGFGQQRCGRRTPRLGHHARAGSARDGRHLARPAP